MRRLTKYLLAMFSPSPSESLVLGGVALLLGLTSGFGVWLFKRLIDLTHLVAFDGLGTALGHLGGWTVFLVPAVGGLVVGLIVHFLIGEERHSGVAGVMEAVALAGGRLRYRRMPAKAVAAALSIGSGASVGPEDPSVQIGANLGSMFGQWFRLSDERVRTLVAAGAASGIAAAFNAPIAGIFFALEIVLGEIGGSALGIVVLAAVISAVFTQAVSGAQPAFHVPAYVFRSPVELLLYFGLGLLAGPVSALYSRGLSAARGLFERWSAPRWTKPIVAGLAVGLVGIGLPQVFGVGYDTIERILNGVPISLWLLLALLAAKLVLTALCIGSGFPGGVIAPALFVGVMVGAAYGGVAARLAPGLQIDPAAFAMVGMAAVLAGAIHAPLTAILLLFEMTNNYQIILPLMFAVVVSLLLSQRLQRDSIYIRALALKGIRLERGRDVEVLEGLTVSEVMQTAALPTLHESDSVSAVADLFMQTRHHGLPVMNAAEELVGIVTVQDLDRANLEHPRENLTVGQVCSRDLLVAYPDESIGTALRRMSAQDVGRLPVVARDQPRRLLGLLRRNDLVRAYNIALTRRAAMRHRAQQVRLGALGEVNVEEIVIEAGARCVGRKVSEVAWPRDCVLATVRRGRQILIPRGDTIIRAGDVLAVVVEGDKREALQTLCQAECQDQGP